MKTKARGERRRIPHRGQEDGPEVATEGEEDVKPNYVRKKRSRNRKTDAKTKTRKKVNDARTTRPSLSGRTGAGRTRGSRKAAKREREGGEASPKRAKDQKTGTRMKKARKKERRVRRHYGLMAVFPLVKPRSWLNVEIPLFYDQHVEVKFSDRAGPGSHNGYTRGFPTNGVYTLKLQMESANLSSTTDESRVQPTSLE